MNLSSRGLRVPVTVLVALLCGVTYGFSRSLEAPADVILSPFLLVTSQKTAYASGYSEQLFRSVTWGMSTNDVERLLGAPLSETWIYDCATVGMVGDKVTSLGNPRCSWPNGKPTSAIEVLKMRGEPRQMIWDYSRSLSQGSYHQRRVYFRRSRVEKKEAAVYLD